MRGLEAAEREHREDCTVCSPESGSVLCEWAQRLRDLQTELYHVPSGADLPFGFVIANECRLHSGQDRRDCESCFPNGPEPVMVGTIHKAAEDTHVLVTPAAPVEVQLSYQGFVTDPPPPAVVVPTPVSKMETLSEHNKRVEENKRIRDEAYAKWPKPSGVACDKCGTEMGLLPPEKGYNLRKPVECASCGAKGRLTDGF